MKEGTAKSEPVIRMLITGANGFIGSRMAMLALEEGHDVRTITRSEWTGAPAVPSEGRFLGSLPGDIPVESFAGVDVVVHCAGTAEPGERSAAAVNVEGTMGLARAARDAGVATFIFLSSQSAKPDAISAYGRTKFEAERQLLGLEGIDVVILRPGLVTGPGARGLFQRMTATVESLPVVPLLGGGKALVQPIHVDDLCAAILQAVRLSKELSGDVLRLGDPMGLSLAELVQEISRARFGRRKKTLPVPIGPVEVAVRAVERLRLPLPVNSNNLKGLRTVERMDTAGDMATLGVPVRTMSDVLGLGNVDEAVSTARENDPVGVLLVGAGRVGLVHAVTLTRLRGAVLAGLVDRSMTAIVFLQRLGIRVSGFSSVGVAVQATHADAAVIATPPATHLALARECLEQGLTIMVEKPLAVRGEQLAEFEALTSEFPEVGLQVGYLMPQIPQVRSMLERLRSGELGSVVGFEGFTLLSFVEGPLEGRWEVDPDVAGGGALINAGGHVLSLIYEAFGEPTVIDASSVRIHSAAVEDSVVTDLAYAGFAGRHYCSWSIAGFPRQENILRVRTDRGELLISNGLATFVADDGTLEVRHGLDVDVGFNMAPDYVGAGFTTELGQLRDAAGGGAPASMDVPKAAAIERLLFGIYGAAKEVQVLEEAAERPVGVSAEPRIAERASSTLAEPRRILDLRGLDGGVVSRFAAREERRKGWDGFDVYPAQLHATWAVPGLTVTVPDFLTQGRLLSLGRRLEVVKSLGLGGGLGAMSAALPQALRDRSATFWVGALGLLGGGLSAIPKAFEGTILLHPALVDLALALRRHDMLDRMLQLCASHKMATIGFHTNLASEAVDALPLMEADLGAVSVLMSPNDGGDDVIARVRSLVARVRIIAEVGQAPPVVQRAAASAPRSWAHGADAVLVGASADASLRSEIASERGHEWARAFPGTSIPGDLPC
jgi:nucleoside-diphosphate-sugar epimerase/predicted dehydrogenase